MFKKIKEKLAKKKQQVEEMAKLEQMKKFYEVVRCGAMFIQYIQNDLNKAMSDNMNRHQRRRMAKSLQKGEITTEIVQHYSKEASRILGRVNESLNPTKPIDGAKMYAKLQKGNK